MSDLRMTHIILSQHGHWENMLAVVICAIKPAPTSSRSVVHAVEHYSSLRRCCRVPLPSESHGTVQADVLTQMAKLAALSSDATTTACTNEIGVREKLFCTRLLKHHTHPYCCFGIDVMCVLHSAKPGKLLQGLFCKMGHMTHSCPVVRRTALVNIPTQLHAARRLPPRFLQITHTELALYRLLQAEQA